MPPIKVDLHQVKEAVSASLTPGHPGRETLLTQPDEMEEAAFDLLFPSLVPLRKR